MSYMTTREAGERLAVAPGTIRRWVREGRLPATRIPGGLLRIADADLVLVLRPARDPRAGRPRRERGRP
ncbi:MAG: excisionase family DNA-binding protein [Planctomycetales bacterium]|nr:excisionase family DNA-binding protein [Planctomycetales bacterium]